ncbi:uncharacterized protein LOC123209027 isoform X3 [Mangifera indica]|uniref:uncharacterized protein LOC123209027 isoform X3 n=1 Tax=Mangifera indica TaxID=29780 RepID=UPI001CFA542C|nr:uncharacterized protein LOC123209027 isoform X3 [Mangifera indica]
MELVLLLQAPLLWDQFLKLVLFCLLVLMPFQTVVSPSLGAVAGWMSNSSPSLPCLAVVSWSCSVFYCCLWEVGSVARLAHKSFKVWDKSAASMPLQVFTILTSYVYDRTPIIKRGGEKREILHH